jgi:hypothetical protein
VGKNKGRKTKKMKDRWKSGKKGEIRQKSAKDVTVINYILRICLKWLG